MDSPSNVDTQNYLVALFKLWERTPADQPAVFDDSRMSAQTQWDSKKVRVLNDHCVRMGWIQYPYEGAKEYTLTTVGISSAREAQRKVSLSL